MIFATKDTQYLEASLKFEPNDLNSDSIVFYLNVISGR